MSISYYLSPPAGSIFVVKMQHVLLIIINTSVLADFSAFFNKFGLLSPRYQITLENK